MRSVSMNLLVRMCVMRVLPSSWNSQSTISALRYAAGIVGSRCKSRKKSSASSARRHRYPRRWSSSWVAGRRTARLRIAPTGLPLDTPTSLPTSSPPRTPSTNTDDPTEHTAATDAVMVKAVVRQRNCTWATTRWSGFVTTTRRPAGIGRALGSEPLVLTLETDELWPAGAGRDHDGAAIDMRAPSADMDLRRYFFLGAGTAGWRASAAW
mmetsp:Transcript_42853/g.132395  ORF Transcript_42853/g.132395 Transcript_42853/m.132395 type:complete len:210 (-) Transcript_42853:810-1439(-)